MSPNLGRVLVAAFLLGACRPAGAVDDPALERERANEEIRKQKIQELYDGLIYPRPQAVVKGEKSVDDIFAPMAQGRITPLGIYPDKPGLVEYFYALALAKGIEATKIDFKTLMAEGDKVAIRVDLSFDATKTPLQRQLKLSEEGFFTFDANNRIVSADLVIPNLGAAINPTSDTAKEAEIVGVCAFLTVGADGHKGTCGSEFTGATDTAKFDDCVAFMKSLPYGSWDRGNSNTFVCRELHSILTEYRPDIHCPHVGKTGGHKCVDFSYESFYEKDF